MKDQNNIFKSQIVVKGYMTGESIEEKMRRVMETKEPIEEISPLIYTERADGVQAAYDIRTDRFEIAQDTMDKIHKSAVVKTETPPTQPKGNGSETPKTE